mgnify:CR=1 FL=1
MPAFSAAEFGWRYGTGKWPDYYVDSVGAVVDIGTDADLGALWAAHAGSGALVVMSSSPPALSIRPNRSAAAP